MEPLVIEWADPRDRKNGIVPALELFGWVARKKSQEGRGSHEQHQEPNGESYTEAKPNNGQKAKESGEEEEFRPLVVTFEGQTLAVESIDERVEEDSEWWENEPVYKMHYRVTLEGGREMAIFRNNKTGSWYESEQARDPGEDSSR